MLQASKQVKLEELVGEDRGIEEQPEGKVVTEPSGEAVVHSSG